MRVPVLMTAHSHSSRGTSLVELHLQSPPFEKGQAPSAFLAFPLDVLPAHPAPEEVVVCKGFPGLGDLRGATEGDGVEVAEDTEIDFTGEKGEGVDADDGVERVGEVG
jgi:hypothetical protein